jgi:hypothetical protein
MEANKPKDGSFPNWKSAWWIAVLLALGWGPPLLINAVFLVFPSLNNHYQLAALGMAWGLTGTIALTALSLISLLTQISKFIVSLAAPDE